MPESGSSGNAVESLSSSSGSGSKKKKPDKFAVFTNPVESDTGRSGSGSWETAESSTLSRGKTSKNSSVSSYSTNESPNTNRHDSHEYEGSNSDVQDGTYGPRKTGVNFDPRRSRMVQKYGPKNQYGRSGSPRSFFASHPWTRVLNPRPDYSRCPQHLLRSNCRDPRRTCNPIILRLTAAPKSYKNRAYDEDNWFDRRQSKRQWENLTNEDLERKEYTQEYRNDNLKSRDYYEEYYQDFKRRAYSGHPQRRFDRHRNISPPESRGMDRPIVSDRHGHVRYGRYNSISPDTRKPRRSSPYFGNERFGHKHSSIERRKPGYSDDFSPESTLSTLSFERRGQSIPTWHSDKRSPRSMNYKTDSKLHFQYGPKDTGRSHETDSKKHRYGPKDMERSNETDSKKHGRGAKDLRDSNDQNRSRKHSLEKDVVRHRDAKDIPSDQETVDSKEVSSDSIHSYYFDYSSGSSSFSKTDSHFPSTRTNSIGTYRMSTNLEKFIKKIRNTYSHIEEEASSETLSPSHINERQQHSHEEPRHSHDRERHSFI